MILSQRDAHDKRTALLRSAFDSNEAAMQFDKLVDQGKAYAATFMGTAANVGNAVEAIEQPGNFLGRNSNARVAHTEFSCASHLLQTNLNLTCKSELESVGDQIEDDLLPHVPIDVRQFAGGFAIDQQSQAGPFCGGAKDAGELCGESRDIRCLVNRVDSTGLDAGEIEQGIHQAQQACAVTVCQLQLLFGRRR